MAAGGGKPPTFRTARAQRAHRFRGRYRTARAQRRLLRCLPREHPCTPPPPTEACMIHSKQRRGCGVQVPGTRGYRRWKTAAFSHSADRRQPRGAGGPGAPEVGIIGAEGSPGGLSGAGAAVGRGIGLPFPTQHHCVWGEGGGGQGCIRRGRDPRGGPRSG